MQNAVLGVSPSWARSTLVPACVGLGLLAACGVQEHAHETSADVSIGGRLAPPPPENGGTGVSATGGAAAGGTAAGGTTAGGSTGAGGANNGGTWSTAGSAGRVASGGTGAGGGPGSGGAPLASGGSAGAANASGGLSGVTVDINGTKLPKEYVVAFIHLGHSNMAGRSSSPSSSRPYHFTDTNLRAWVYRASNWTPALEPNTAGDADAKRLNQGGPGTSLLKQALDDAPARYFVSLGFGIGSAYCSQFLPGGLYYDKVIAAPKELKGQVTFGAILIMLGITERHGTSEDINGYANCINKLATAIRTDVGEPNLPLLVTDYEMEATGSELSPTGSFAQQIIPQIHKIPDVVSNAALVPTDGIAMQDDHHFNLDGQKTWTRRALDVMKSKGWVKW